LRFPRSDDSLELFSLSSLGLVLVIMGFVLAFVAVILLALRGRGTGGQTKGAGILLIGPIPIVFGSDRDSVRTLMILAIVLIVIVLAFILLPSLLLSR
jgi:uncharacterized protein (TIGR00304 family)